MEGRLFENKAVLRFLKRFPAIIEPLTTELHYRAFNEPADRVQIVRGTLGDDAGILGAARLARRGLLS